LNVGRQRIRRHPADGCGGKDARPVEFTIVEQHLAEPQIVRGCRHQPAAAENNVVGLVTSRSGRILAPAGASTRRRASPAAPETGIDHAERLKQAAVEKPVQWLA